MKQQIEEGLRNVERGRLQGGGREDGGVEG